MYGRDIRQRYNERDSYEHAIDTLKRLNKRCKENKIFWNFLSKEDA